ncbi:protein Wnt-8a-like [Zophobas morio]|uniref:protein Wnt-8a-like n=1 Tax=Zophobas morio TaxID=2755281 RepID=UPI0030833F8D
MSSKIFFLALWIYLLIIVSVSRSTSINSILKSKALQDFNRNLNPAILRSVDAGAQMAMDLCRDVFKWERWNCPPSAFSKQMNQQPTREKAYVDAILAAGIIYSITKDCSEGVIEECGCNSNLKREIEENAIITSYLFPSKLQMERDWAWGGCSDDSSFGENLVLKLLDKNEKSGDPQSFVSRHNNRIGREIIREKMMKSCQCHGVSGSCSFQTCWMKMPTFPQIAKQLKERYDRAMFISYEKIGVGVALGNSARQTLFETDIKILSKGNLLYLEKSPNYCFEDIASGWPGTLGRTCSKTTNKAASISERRSCRHLCRSCGFKARKQQKQVTRMCNCKFTFCCEVKCDVCVEMVNEHYCH